MRSGARSAALLALLMGTGCASSPPRPVEPAAEPALDYGQRVRARIEAARREPHVLVRHNPAPCGCPPFEVMLGGFWHRVAFDVRDEEDPTVVALSEAARDAPPEAVATWRVAGHLDDVLSTCGRGTVVVSLRPAELVP